VALAAYGYFGDSSIPVPGTSTAVNNIGLLNEKLMNLLAGMGLFALGEWIRR
jgi:hypothetical protein